MVHVDRVLALLWSDGSQVRDDRLRVVRVEVLQAVLDGFAHRAGGGSAAVRMPVDQVVNDLGITPRSDTEPRVRGDVDGPPSLERRAGKLLAVVEGEAEVAGRVALVAMTQRGREVGASVPLGGLLRIGLESRALEEDRIPESHGPALVERKAQRGRRGLLVHRWQAEQVGLDRQGVAAAECRVGRVGECRVKTLAVVANSLVQGTHELVIGPLSDAGLLVGRDVG